MRRLAVLFLCVATALLLPATAHAQVTLYSSFIASDAYNGSGPNFGTLEPGLTRVEASPFTVPFGSLTGKYTLTQIDLAIHDLYDGATSGGTPEPPYVFQVQLTADAGNSPGTVLETWTVSSPNPVSNTQIFTVLDVVHLTLVSGHQYWVTVGSSGTNGWGWDVGFPSSTIGTVASSDNGGPFGLATNVQVGGFDVKGQAKVYIWPPRGLGFNQVLHVVAGPITPPAGSPVEANISFTDINGNPIGPSSLVTVNPGQLASFDFPANQFIKPGQQIEVVPVVTPVAGPNGAATSGIEVSAEVRDVLLGIGTGLIVPPTWPPNPDAPSLVTQGLAGGQTMRLTLQAFPPSPCNATVSFADSNGNPLNQSQQVNLAPGTGTSIDLTAESVGLKLGQRVDVQPMVSLSQIVGAAAVSPSPCQATVEVFDQLTLRTETYQTAPVQAPSIP